MTRIYSVKDIKDMILKINDVKELLELNRFLIKKIKSEQWLKGQVTKADLSLGLRVEWTGKKGHQMGYIVKLNRTRAVVENDLGQKWNVPFSMLNKVK